MTKTKLFLDMDGTLTSSCKAFCEAYNIIYKYHKCFTYANWELVREWNMQDQCTCLKSHSDVLEIFESPVFFKMLKFINHNTYEVAKEISKKYQVIIASIGTPKNLSLKSLYLKDNLPFIQDYILLCNNGCKMNKEIIQMNYPDSIFIDDVTTNLDSSNAQNKFIFGLEYPWSETKNYSRLLDWTEVANKLL